MAWVLKKSRFIALLSLTILTIIVWLSVWQIQPKNHVRVSFLDVGQGDAILLTASNGNQILIDGGRDKRVLSKLSREMPFFDRSIDVVIATHPDADHIGGLPKVLVRYNTGVFLESGAQSDSTTDSELKRIIGRTKKELLQARGGMVVSMGDGSYLQILFPDRDVSGLDTNDASIVAKYVFGDTCFLLTGDSPIKIEDYLVSLYGESLSCDVLKVGHHGSNTSTGEKFLNAVSPQMAIISAGKDNSYGHPHAEVVERLRQKDVEILNTAETGTIRIKANTERLER